MIGGLKMGISLGMKIPGKLISIITIFIQLLSSIGEILKDSDGKNLGGFNG